ncbi:MAG: phosphotransferase [Planctomycetales bacterium]|nr:phosphotransferase [Planctomycetales bacterium]
MSSEQVVHRVLAAYPAAGRPRRIQDLGSAGGFSGARFWRLETDLGPLCLRRWPPQHPDAARLAFIHQVLQHVHRQGFLVVPLPWVTSGTSDQTFVSQEGFLWELTCWLPGRADYHQRPSRQRLAAAMQALAGFHQAAADFLTAVPPRGPSPQILARMEMVARWRSGDLERLVASLGGGTWPELEPLAERIVARFQAAGGALSARLQAAAEVAVPQQPCIRDVWDRHVLFQDDVVTGLIDFGAMQIDTVSTDIARLLGSLAADNPGDWQAGLDAYQQLRPLAPEEQQLIGVFDSSIVLLAGLNWLRWIYLENRQFPDKQAVFSRITTILARLERVSI